MKYNVHGKLTNGRPEFFLTGHESMRYYTRLGWCDDDYVYRVNLKDKNRIEGEYVVSAEKLTNVKDRIEYTVKLPLFNLTVGAVVTAVIVAVKGVTL